MSAVEERFGPYGGRYVPETLIAALDELDAAWGEAREDAAFGARLEALRRDFIGRPTPLYLAERLSERAGRRVYLKREDLAHTGAHKINNAVGQVLLAERMGKRRIIAETGAGQHGVATATACALLGLECVVYMGSEDIRRQRPNVERMGLLGAEVVPVEAGARTLKEAVSAAIRDWVANVATTHYVIGSAVGPAPFPALVRDLQLVIGTEAREQALAAEGALPARVIACVGGGSNSIGIFTPFVEDEGVALVGVEAAGEGLDSERHGASLGKGSTGVLHGSLSSIIADEEGQILEAHSVSAGLDYPGSGRSTPGCGTRGGPATSQLPTRMRWRRSRCFPSWRGSSRRLSPRTRLRGCSRTVGGTGTTCCVCPGGATRISPRCLRRAPGGDPAEQQRGGSAGSPPGARPNHLSRA